MQTITRETEKILKFNPDIDHLQALGTQIQWRDSANAEAGTVLLLAETDGPPVHYHPLQEELFYVRQGTLMVFKKDQWIKLSAGDSLKISRKTAHTYKNISGEPVIFDFTITPRYGFRKMIEEMDFYVRQGKIKGKDFRSILYLCRVMNNHPDVTQSVKPPQLVVKLMARLSKIFLK